MRCNNGLAAFNRVIYDGIQPVAQLQVKSSSYAPVSLVRCKEDEPTILVVPVASMGCSTNRHDYTSHVTLYIQLQNGQDHDRATANNVGNNTKARLGYTDNADEPGTGRKCSESIFCWAADSLDKISERHRS
jgi:hypothetical protein